ncbi:lysylphosphatidylglycerol synthase domain-containing protein [candidate division KSB1 bacterium]
MRKSWFKLLLSVVLLFVLIRIVEIRSIVDSLLQVKGLYITGALLLLIPNILLQWYKWHFLVRLKHPDAPFIQTISSLLSGMTLGLATPGRSGELGRAWFLPYKQKAALLTYTVVDKMYAFAALLMVGGFTLIYSLNVYYSIHTGVLLPFVVVYAGIFIVTSMTILNPQSVTGYIADRKWKILQQERVRQLLAELLRINRAVSLKIFIISVAFVLVYFIQFYILVCAFERIEFLPGMAAVASVLLCNVAVPFFFGNLGIRESAAVFFLGHLNVSMGAAFNSALLLFTVNILLPALIGCGLIAFGNTALPVRQKSNETHLPGPE